MKPEPQIRLHELKCRQPYFEDVASGRKRFEVRRDDRGFRVGDVLRLREWSEEGRYTGREARQRVTYLLRGPFGDGLTAGHVVLGLEPVHAATKPGGDLETLVAATSRLVAAIPQRGVGRYCVVTPCEACGVDTGGSGTSRDVCALCQADDVREALRALAGQP